MCLRAIVEEASDKRSGHHVKISDPKKKTKVSIRS